MIDIPQSLKDFLIFLVQFVPGRNKPNQTLTLVFFFQCLSLFRSMSASLLNIPAHTSILKLSLYI